MLHPGRDDVVIVVERQMSIFPVISIYDLMKCCLRQCTYRSACLFGYLQCYS